MAEPLYPLLTLSRLRMGIDGKGVTTLIGGAGCPLSCRWCINQRLLREGKPTPVTASELVEQLRIDDLYFRATGGGVCFGGGESLLHGDFLRAFRSVAPADCKSMDREVYRRYTGGDGALMEENLRLLLSLAGPERIRVRVPLIPGYNSPDLQRQSADRLQALGFPSSCLDLFSYVIRENHSTESR